MQDSNQLHAVCLDTYPPCVYMNTISHNIVQLVHEFNRVSKSTKVLYGTYYNIISIYVARYI